MSEPHLQPDHARAEHTVDSDLAWLVRLRWVAFAGQFLTLLAVHLLLSARFERFGLLVAVVVVGALSNVWLYRWSRGRVRTPEVVLVSITALDFALLTALLAGSGGASNPFSVLYVVHVALAAVLLRRRLVWLIAALSVGCFALLFVIDDGGMHHHHDMRMHYRGMWGAFAVATATIAYFVGRIRQGLEAQRTATEQAKARAARSDRLASLATLAAGAAHELATPLSTIAVVAKELERGLTALPRQAEDARLIRAEVARCRSILEQLAMDAGTTMGEPFVACTLTQLLSESVASLFDAERITQRVDAELALEVPRRALGRVLRGLIKNALEAGQHTQVEVVAGNNPQAKGQVEVRIHDRGDGIPKELLARIGEPFFTTKPTGQGMGLGVFLARAVLERLGGELTFEHAPERGTHVTVRFPQRPFPNGPNGPDRPESPERESHGS